MSRLASDAELIMIEKELCPHCGSNDIDVDTMGPLASCDVCNVCFKHWTTYSNGRIELEAS